MRQRRQIAACADASLRWNERHRIGVEQALKRLDDERTNARMPAAKANQFQDDHQPGDVARKRVSQSGAMRQDQICLKLGETVGWNAGVCQEAEAVIDSIDRLAARNDALDRCC